MLEKEFHLIEANLLEKLKFNDFIKFLSNKSIFFKIQNLNQVKIIAEYISRLSVPNFYHNNPKNNLMFSNKIIEIAVAELLINSIEHGILNIDNELKTKLLEDNTWEQYIFTQINNAAINKIVKIFIEFHPEDKDKFLITVQDPGKGFDFNKLLTLADPHSTLSKHGRGLILIKNLPDLKYQGVGNIVTFSIKFDVSLFKY